MLKIDKKIKKLRIRQVKNLVKNKRFKSVKYKLLFFEKISD